MKKLKSTILFLMLVFCGNLIIAQNTINVSGKVISSEDGLGVPGVSVSIKGTTTGAITTVSGEYAIQAPNGSTLLFSFVGMKSKEIVVDRNVINVTLEPDMLGLEEVVVTGLAGKTSKKKLTFSLEQVGTEELQRTPASNVAAALQGKIAGLRIIQSSAPGGSAEMMLRGATTLRSSNSPLVVVDGVLTSGSIRDINIHDVEKVEVLKGASAASLYGSRAANGVIAIYTKRGIDNEIGTSKVRIRSEYGFESVYKSRQPEKTNSHRFLTNDDGSIMLNSSGRGVEDPESIFDNPFKTTYDHLGDFLKGSPYHSHYVEVSNRSKSSNILFSAEYYKMGGALEHHDGNDRINLRLNADQYLGDKVKISASTLLIRQKFDRSPVYIENLLMADPSDDLLKPNPDGTPFNVAGNKFVSPYSYMNPFYYLTNRINERNRSRVLGNFSLSYFISDAFTFETRYGLDYRSQEDEFFENPGFLAVGQGTIATGEIGRDWSENMAVTSTQTLSYFKEFGDLKLKSRLFYQYETEKWKGFGVDGIKLGVEDFNDFDNVQTPTELGQVNITAYSNNTKEITSHSFALATGLDYKDRYILDFVVRREAVSLFGVDERWQTFGRVSGAYRVSEDINIPNVQELSLRASYGTAGGRPGFIDQYQPAEVVDGKPTKPSQKGNPILKPNITSEMELSIRADVFNKFSILASYSEQENKDQILSIPLSAATGFSYIVENAGTLSTKNYELNIDYNAIQTEDMSLNFGLSLSKGSQKITEFNRTDLKDDLRIFSEGNSLTAMYGQRMATSLNQVENQLPEGELLDEYFAINRDGFVIRNGTEFTEDESVIILKDDNGARLAKEKIGDAESDLDIGFTTNFQYKGLGVSMNWGAQIGGDVYNIGAQRMAQYGLSKLSDQAAYKEGERKYASYFESLYNRYEYVDYWVEDGTFLKLRELAISYDVSDNLLSKLGLNNVFKSMKFSLMGRNLFVFSNYSGFDPETGGINTRVDDFNYPLVRTYTAAIDITF